MSSARILGERSVGFLHIFTDPQNVRVMVNAELYLPQSCLGPNESAATV